MAGKVIAVISSKGGVGKTTTTAALAVKASDGGKTKVAILDLDPQQALARWWELRSEFVTPLFKEQNRDVSPKLFRNVENARADVEILKSKGYEWIFIDTPPAMMEWIEMAVIAADLVLIPVRASPIDLEAIDPAIELCEAYGRPFGFVLTHYDPKWKLSQTAIPVLAERGKVFEDQPLSYLQAYVGAMLAGKTGPEFSDKRQAKATEDEVNKLWEAVKKLAKTAKLAKV
jgi:chromosome partitioning protein